MVSDARGKQVLSKRFGREGLIDFMANSKPCLVGIEACGGIHYWARLFSAQGHTLMNPLILKRKGSQSKTLVDAVNFQSFASDHLAHFEESDKNICSKIDLAEIMSVFLFSQYLP